MRLRLREPRCPGGAAHHRSSTGQSVERLGVYRQFDAEVGHSRQERPRFRPQGAGGDEDHAFSRISSADGQVCPKLGARHVATSQVTEDDVVWAVSAVDPVDGIESVSREVHIMTSDHCLEGEGQRDLRLVHDEDSRSMAGHVAPPAARPVPRRKPTASAVFPARQRTGCMKSARPAAASCTRTGPPSPAPSRMAPRARGVLERVGPRTAALCLLLARGLQAGGAMPSAAMGSETPAPWQTQP